MENVSVKQSTSNMKNSPFNLFILIGRCGNNLHAYYSSYTLNKKSVADSEYFR